MADTGVAFGVQVSNKRGPPRGGELLEESRGDRISYVDRSDQRRLKDGRFALERGREHRLSHYRGTNLRYRAGFVFSKRIVLNRFCQQRCTQVITSARGGGRRHSGLHPPCLQPGGRLYGRAAHVRRLPIQ